MTHGVSFASAGLTTGQFIDLNWSADSLCFTTGGASSVPEPTSLARVGLALAGLDVSKKRKRA